MLIFTFNNKSCTDFGLYIKKTNHLNSFERNIESISIPGRTGNVLIDDGSYKNKIIDIECILKADFLLEENISLYQASKNISLWLQGIKGYQKLTFNDGSIFNAVCINQIEIDKLVRNFADVMISFEIEAENPSDIMFKK